jgi:prolipoprotein diacylglyceryl transferase
VVHFVIVLLAYIPSPHSGALTIGPLTLHMYGLTLLVAILAAIWLTGRRWVALGGEWELVTRVAVWGVAFGVIGARAYHDITSWNEVPAPKWQGIFEVWRGGLGIWGGIALGALVGAVVVRRAGISAATFLDVAAPGLLLAQAIGRIGNYWNQELYGKPTTLPWGLKIDPANRPLQYFDRATFHPTFLYELLWDGIGVLILLYVAKRFRIRAPGLFALYVAYYCFGRFFEELLRVDPAHHFWGLRLNAWVSIAVFVAAAAYFIRHQFFGKGRSGAREARHQPPKGPAMAIPKGRVR